MLNDFGLKNGFHKTNDAQSKWNVTQGERGKDIGQGQRLLTIRVNNSLVIITYKRLISDSKDPSTNELKVIINIMGFTAL